MSGAQFAAWRPRLDGVVEVLSAHFTGHAYPMHAHDTWTLTLTDASDAIAARRKAWLGV